MAITAAAYFPYWATLSLNDDLGKIKVIARVLKLRNVLGCDIVWAWHKFVTLLLASVDTGIYPPLASQYHAGPSAARGIAMGN